MKLTQEKFDKLKQLDRIEFRLKENKIKENYSPINYNEAYLFGFLSIFLKIIIDLTGKTDYYSLLGISLFAFAFFALGSIFYNFSIR